MDETEKLPFPGMGEQMKLEPERLSAASKDFDGVLLGKSLSVREIEVVKLVVTGITNKEVAGQLFVTEKTIKFHMTNIYKKMGVKSRSQLIVWCSPHLDFK